MFGYAGRVMYDVMEYMFMVSELSRIVYYYFHSSFNTEVIYVLTEIWFRSNISNSELYDSTYNVYMV